MIGVLLSLITLAKSCFLGRVVVATEDRFHRVAYLFWISKYREGREIDLLLVLSNSAKGIKKERNGKIH